jgi:Zn-dependent peptidase ImmA (M78 family)/transcriptional regulator with XRE-family HTH domain
MVTVGERLKMARAMAGLALREVAQKAGVSHMAISKYERGLDVPSSSVLLRLAEALGVKLDYLFRPTSIVLNPEIVHYRCRSRCGVKARDQVQGEVSECMERYLEVEGLFGEPEPFSKPQIDLEVRRLEDIEGLAAALRANWELGHDPIENLMAVFEDKGVRVCLVQGCESFDGLCAWVQEGIPVIAAQRGVPGDRQRFNLAHELAHLLLHLGPDVGEEAAAHRFSGAFLAPEPVVRAELGEHRRELDPHELYLLKHKYGLSMQAWVRRAKDLGIIEEASYERICQRFSQLGWRKHEPWEQVPTEEPKRMQQLIFRALAEDMISRSRAMELLGEEIAEVELTLA